jgi:hypothetical protein
MIYSLGNTYHSGFICYNTSGQLVNADSLPSAVCRRNGSVDLSFILTVSNTGTGIYTVSGTVPGTVPLTWNIGDICEILVTATIESDLNESITDEFRIVIDSQTGEYIAPIVVPTNPANGLQNVYFLMTDLGLTDQTGTVYAQVNRKNEHIPGSDTILTKGLVTAVPVSNHWEIYVAKDSTCTVVGIVGQEEFLRKDIVITEDDTKSLSTYL